MKQESDHGGRMLPATEFSSHFAQAALDNRIKAATAGDGPRKHRDDDVLLKVEISVNKKAVDALGKTFTDAMNFLPNLIIEGEHNAERAVKNMQQGLGNAWQSAQDGWNHGVHNAEQGMRDASVHTYKTINFGAAQMQRDATTVVSSTQHAVECGVHDVQRGFGNALHQTEQFAQHTVHDVAKGTAQHFRSSATALDPDRTDPKFHAKPFSHIVSFG